MFNICLSSYLIWRQDHSFVLCSLLAANIAIQITIAIVRTQDYIAVRNGVKMAQAAVRAASCGKAATFQSNLTYALAALSAMVPVGSPGLAMEVVLVVSMVITVDCTLKSLEQKLLNRRAHSQVH